MIKILHVVPNMQAGGLETFIMNIMRNISDEVEFDFLVHYKEKKFYDDEIERLGGTIYRFSLRDDHNIFKYIGQLNKFFKNHKEYKIIHCHMPSIGFLIFLIAKKNGIKVRIAHSHHSNCEKNLKGYVKNFLSKFFKYTSTHNFACSQDAGKYLFGKKKYTVIPNAIELDKFKFDVQQRAKIRKELKINDNTMVIGHIGRFCEQKNHDKLIDIFNDYQKINPNSVLLLVGTGETLEKTKNKVASLNLENNVRFLGVRKDTPALYSAFDAFLLPSTSEGLGIVLIEAQMSGLYCYTTDKKVPKAALISDRLTYLDGDKNSEMWANELIKENNYDRKNINFNKNKDNYDIKQIAKELEKFYKENSNY